MFCIIPTLMVSSFFFNSRILQSGILQTGPNQSVENQKQNQDNTGRFGMKNLPNCLKIFFTETSFPKRPAPLEKKMNWALKSVFFCSNTKIIS